MATAKINAGICGYHTTVVAETAEGYHVNLTIQSECAAIQRLGEHLTQVDALNEISCRSSIPDTLQKGIDYCSHAACPVPSGIIKAVEVEAGLALPKDVTIKLEK